MFEEFSLRQKAIGQRTQKEITIVQNWLKSTKKPQRQRIALFKKSGAFEYALQFLFEHHSSAKFNRKRIEERIANIRTLLDGGGPSIDPDRHDCAAVRIAIHRLPARYKEWCTKFLAHHLKT